MPLSDLILKKRKKDILANATNANPANSGATKQPPLAELADLALATPTDAAGAPVQDVPRSWWRVAYPGREPVRVNCVPPATRAEVLAGQAGATAEPCGPPLVVRPKLLTGRDEMAIRDWLRRIGETDPEIVREVITAALTDANARWQLLQKAGAVVWDPEAVDEAVEERTAIMGESGPDPEVFQRVTALARSYYNHVFRGGCCYAPVGRHCAEGERLRLAYYRAAAEAPPATARGGGFKSLEPVGARPSPQSKFHDGKIQVGGYLFDA